MNIVLADVLPLSINLPDSAVESDSESGEFSDLIKSSLVDYSLDSEQVSENKELILSLLDLETIDENAIPILPVAGTSIADATVTTDPDPAKITVAGLMTPIPGVENASKGNSLPVDPNLTDSKNDITKPVEGVALPVTGKVLPRNGESPDEVSIPGSRQIPQQVETPSIPLTRLELTQESDNKETNRISLTHGESRQFMQASDQNSSINSDKLVETIPSKILELATGQYSQHDSAAARPIVITPAATQASLQLSTPLPAQLEPLTIARPDSPVEWSHGIGERVSWMINQKLNTATIRLDPPSLGKLEIHIQVRDEVTQITINVQNSHTRELIDNASMRLRDVLQEAGYQNVNVDVGHDRNQSRPGSQQNGDVATGSGDNSNLQHELSNDTGSTAVGFYKSDSIVDYFA